MSKWLSGLKLKYITLMKMFYFADRDPCSESGGLGVDYADDGICDDANNIEECQWDGGDCCGDNVVTSDCSVCACLDPRETTVATTTTTAGDKGEGMQGDHFFYFAVTI